MSKEADNPSAGQPAEGTDRTSLAVKIWLGGGIPLWLVAKVHTLRTWNSGQYLELHWPFWVAMILWSSFVFGVDRYVTHLRMRRHPGSRSS